MIQKILIKRVGKIYQRGKWFNSQRRSNSWKHNSGEIDHKAETKTLDKRDRIKNEEFKENSSRSYAKAKRGLRGGRGNRRKDSNKDFLQKQSSGSNSPVYSYQKIQIDKKIQKLVKASTKLLKELIGKSIHTQESNY